ncbi:hypothetical protein TrCOL_g13633 [Triparma columacea]|uniref:Uncharacterized protein n=1 Tax=Triparma columacea TaxID=722753 RepID=A0A9W7FW75_9STRA|nr:hypothetical protein TrCOL_g13633 [Triparma columacea]
MIPIPRYAYPVKPLYLPSSSPKLFQDISLTSPSTTTKTTTSLYTSASPPSQPTSLPLDRKEASKFTLLACTGPKCTRANLSYSSDPEASFNLLADRLADTGVEIEEVGCLGWCKRAPCVSVEHEEYEGRIGLEGMTDSEGAQKMFFGVVEGEGGRIEEAVRGGIRQMMELEDEGGEV